MAAMILNVNAQDLINTAEAFRTSGNHVNELTNNMMNTVNGMNNAWRGDAANAYMGRFNQLEDDMQRLFSMINEHVNDLEEMASNYTESEMSNEEYIETLSTDVII